MKPWWIIKYYDGSGTYDSAMLPFKLLPKMLDVNLRRGHKFKTDQFEIEIPESRIKLYMPSRTIWVNGKVYMVEDATRVILFTKNYVRGDGESWREICIGLLANDGNGTIVTYHEVDKSCHITEVIGGLTDSPAVKQGQPKISELEGV